jgi:hypothetical protein
MIFWGAFSPASASENKKLSEDKPLRSINEQDKKTRPDEKNVLTFHGLALT